MRAELEGAPAGEALPRQQIGGEQADGGGERRRDRRDLRASSKNEFQAEPEKNSPRGRPLDRESR